MTTTTRLRIGTSHHEVDSLSIKQSTYLVTVWLLGNWPKARKLPAAGHRISVVNKHGESVLSIVTHRAWRAKGIVHVEGRRLLGTE